MTQDEDYKSEKSKRQPAPSRSTSNRHSFPKRKSAGAPKVSKKQTSKEKSKTKEQSKTKGWAYVEEPFEKNIFLETKVLGKRRSSQTGRGRESMGAMSVPKMGRVVKKEAVYNAAEIEEIEAEKIVAVNEVAMADQPLNPLTDPEASVTIADLEEMPSSHVEIPISKVSGEPVIETFDQNPASADEAANQSAIYGNFIHFSFLFNGFVLISIDEVPEEGIIGVITTKSGEKFHTLSFGKLVIAMKASDFSLNATKILRLSFDNKTTYKLVASLPGRTTIRDGSAISIGTWYFQIGSELFHSF